jgi:nucleoside-diphosphate-sugar epimerase
VPDISRARKLVGFEPVTSLAEIVDTMIDDARRRH